MVGNKPLPCRKCGTEPKMIVDSHYIGFTKEKEPTYRYICPKCKRNVTNPALSERVAIRSWNREQGYDNISNVVKG